MRNAVVLVGLVLGSAFGSSPSTRAEDFKKWVVVAREENAVKIGRDAMRNGGNAIDAAVATALAMAVTHPEAGNIGGGGFIVAYLAKDQKVVTFDFRETAPSRASERMYLSAEGKLLPRHRAGPLAAGVPGTVRGLGLAHSSHGKLPWKDLVVPAAKLARDGFAINQRLARSLNAELFPQPVPAGRSGQSIHLADFPETVAAFAKPDRSPWKPGETLRQNDLADTLDRIAREGPDEFYRGQTARLIVQSMEHGGGLISLADLENYRAKTREPIHTQFRGFDVYGMAPPSSGGVTIGLMLNILERYDLKADGPRSPRTIHRVAEAMRRAYFVRATELADPDFVTIPVEKLISKPFADSLAKSIHDDSATSSFQLAPFPIASDESTHTTHLSTIDGEGNAAALTYTLEDSYGSRSVVAGCGFLLNNEMGDFNLTPGLTDLSGDIGTEPNRIKAGKRMLSSQAPAIVLDHGKVAVVTGSPGGRTIPNTVLWVLLNLLEFQLDPEAAVEAPRTHHQWFPDVLSIEGSPIDPILTTALTKMGHRIQQIHIQGDAHTIVVDPKSGVRRGIPDPRRGKGRCAGD